MFSQRPRRDASSPRAVKEVRHPGAMPLQRLLIENFKSYRGTQEIGPFYAFSAVSAYILLTQSAPMAVARAT